MPTVDEPIWFTDNHSEPRKVATMTAFTVRLPDEVANKLEQLAEKLDRSRSYMAARAIEDFVAREEWQLAEIEAQQDGCWNPTSYCTTKWASMQIYLKRIAASLERKTIWQTLSGNM